MPMYMASACHEDLLKYIKYKLDRGHIVKAARCMYVTRRVGEAALRIAVMYQEGFGMESTGYSISSMICTQLCCALFVVDMLSTIRWIHVIVYSIFAEIA